MTRKTNWCTVKPFLTKNSCISNDFLGIENERNLICNEQELMELFNEQCINIVEKSPGKIPLSLGNSSDASQDEMTVKEIISVYSNHTSIRKSKKLSVPENKLNLPYAGTCNINKIIKSLHVNKAKRPNGISAKFVKMSVKLLIVI